MCELLVCCRHALAPCSELLLELAFTLAADSWPAVAAAPRVWLARVQREGSLDAHLPQASAERFIGRLLRQLLPAVRSMEGDGPALANRLAAAMQVWQILMPALPLGSFIRHSLYACLHKTQHGMMAPSQRSISIHYADLYAHICFTSALCQEWCPSEAECESAMANEFQAAWEGVSL